MQSSARRSYNAVVIPTDALLTLGMLKLTSRMMELGPQIAAKRRCYFRLKCFSCLPTADELLDGNKQMQAAEMIGLDV